MNRREIKAFITFSALKDVRKADGGTYPWAVHRAVAVIDGKIRSINIGSSKHYMQAGCYFKFKVTLKENPTWGLQGNRITKPSLLKDIDDELREARKLDKEERQKRRERKKLNNGSSS